MNHNHTMDDDSEDPLTRLKRVSAPDIDDNDGGEEPTLTKRAPLRRKRLFTRPELAAQLAAELAARKVPKVSLHLANISQLGLTHGLSCCFMSKTKFSRVCFL